MSEKKYYEYPFEIYSRMTAKEYEEFVERCKRRRIVIGNHAHYDWEKDV